MDWPLALLITIMIVATIFGAWFAAIEWGRAATLLGDILEFAGRLLISWFIGALLWGAIALIFWVWAVVHW